MNTRNDLEYECTNLLVEIKKGVLILIKNHSISRDFLYFRRINIVDINAIVFILMLAARSAKSPDFEE